VVSGDYCDVVVRDTDHARLLMLLGDVAGKGVGASLLMSHMHAMFRSLSMQGGGINQMVEQANRLLCESTQQSHYATLVCVETTNAGDVAVCNGGALFSAGVRREWCLDDWHERASSGDVWQWQLSFD